MDRKPPRNDRSDASREDRLKAALKSNLARRKQQARARAETPAPETPEETGDTPSRNKD